MNFLKHFTALAAFALLLGLSTGAKALTVDAFGCDVIAPATTSAYGSACVKVGDWPEPGGSSNPADEMAKIESEFNLTAGSLNYLYKQDQGTVGDAGGYRDSYSTTFANSPSDPQEATITYDGAPDLAISCPACYLFVKDGNATPNAYIFDLSASVYDLGAGLGLGSWNGTDVLSLINFWPSNGAISHVALYGTSVVPVPAAVWLFGTALLGFIGFSRRTQV